jgi:hypothetical protein
MAMDAHARTTPQDIFPVYNQAQRFLEATGWQDVSLVFPDTTIPPSTTAIEAYQRTLVTARTALAKTELAELHKKRKLNELPFDIMRGMWVPPASRLAERPHLAAMLQQTPEAQQARALGLGFIAIAGNEVTPQLKVGYANPYDGEYVAHSFPILSMLADLRKTGGKYVVTEPTGNYL